MARVLKTIGDGVERNQNLSVSQFGGNTRPGMGNNRPLTPRPAQGGGTSPGSGRPGGPSLAYRGYSDNQWRERKKY